MSSEIAGGRAETATRLVTTRGEPLHDVCRFPGLRFAKQQACGDFECEGRRGSVRPTIAQTDTLTGRSNR